MSVCIYVFICFLGTQALGASVPADIAQHKLKDPVDFSRNKSKIGKKKKELKAINTHTTYYIHHLLQSPFFL